MNTRRGLLLALLCVALALALARKAGWLAPAPVAAPARPSPPALPRFQSRWANEEEWLVDRVTHDVAGMAAYASRGSQPPQDAPAAKPAAIRVEGHILSPLNYEPWAREALAGTPGSGADAVSAAEDARLLTALLEPRAEVLVREDERLSRGLEVQPRDALAHERAALLLGAFALRDAAGRFGDVRPELCRMSAHLALARALRAGGPGRAGLVAEAALETLVGRQIDALTRLAALAPGASAAERAWLRALRLRNTGDWRLARDERRLTLLEEREEFRALVTALDDATALAWLDRRSPTPLPDWGRIASLAAFSVATGGRFTHSGPLVEIDEARRVWSLLGKPAVDEAAFLAALEERAGPLVSADATGRPRLAVLGWGPWASSAQRHLLFHVRRAQYYLGVLLGRPGAARAYAEQAREAWGRLSLYPIILRCYANDPASYRVAMSAARDLAIRSPEKLTGGHLEILRAKVDFPVPPGELPDEARWFSPPLPRGTLLDATLRVDQLAALRALSSRELDALRSPAPWNADLALAVVARRPAAQQTVAEIASVLGPLAEYHAEALGKLADAAWYDPVEFARRQGALCAILPERCFVLGYRLAETGHPDEAAAAYQDGFDRANDRVLAANQARWLVDYRFDHGELRRAEAVARRAAAVYSEAGLFVMAKLLERTGRLDAAEEHYRRILDRYEHPDPLVGFYYRQARAGRKPAYEPKLQQALALAQPAGLEPLERAALSGPPADGAVLRGGNDNTKRCGLKWGDVIVGLDGFRVRSRRGYEAVNALSLGSQLRLVVWDGARYADVTIELWDRSFRVEIEDFAPAKPGAPPRRP